MTNLKELAKEKQITVFPIRPCSFCGVWVEYVVLDKDYNNLGLDTSCDCVTYTNINRASWEDMQETLEMQSQEVQKNLLKKWGLQ